MSASARYRLVLDRLQTQGRVDVAELAEALQTSKITVRRDLEHLAEIGALRRVRGGAVPMLPRGEGLPFALRIGEDAALKTKLAVAAASLVTDGEAVAIDSGTTGLAIANALAGTRITAIPLSVQTLAAFAGSTSSVIAPGGELDPTEGSFEGPLLEQTLGALRLDTMMLTCCAVGVEAGVMAYTIANAAAKRAAIHAAARTILIAESSKFNRTAMSLVCPLDQISLLVSNRGLPLETIDLLHKRNVEVKLVEVPEADPAG